MSLPSRAISLSAISLCAALACAGPAAAVDCTNAATTYEMNQCADRDFQAADAQMNKSYQKALANVQNSDLAPPYDAKSWEAAMRAAQRAWVAYRDADCKDLMPMEWSGGTGTTGAVLGCMTEKTLQRTKDLEDRYNSN